MLPSCGGRASLLPLLYCIRAPGDSGAACGGQGHSLSGVTVLPAGYAPPARVTTRAAGMPPGRPLARVHRRAARSQTYRAGACAGPYNRAASCTSVSQKRRARHIRVDIRDARALVSYAQIGDARAMPSPKRARTGELRCTLTAVLRRACPARFPRPVPFPSTADVRYA